MPDEPDAPEAADDREPEPPVPPERVYTCERCGAVMEEIHCKIMCKNCGYFRDCSDP